MQINIIDGNSSMIVSEERLKYLRTEFNRPLFKRMLKETLGCRCTNCNSENDIEYHHIVPLVFGGTNNLGNIVPLCHECHRFAHECKEVTKVRRGKTIGRHRKQPVENYEQILDAYLRGEIGRKECNKLLKLSKSSKLNDKWYFKEYIEKRNIKSFKNKVDTINSNSNKSIEYHKGDIIAEIVYSDGTIKRTYIR